MGGAFADAVGDGFETLADCDNKGGRDGGAVDPIAIEVLRLEAGVRWNLEKVGGQHGIFMRSYALGLVGGWEGRGVWVFDYFELVLLVLVEEAVKGCRGQVEGFSDQRGECRREGGHLRDVDFVGGAEGRKVVRGGPLVWSKEVVVSGRGSRRERMRGGNIDLFTPVCA